MEDICQDEFFGTTVVIKEEVHFVGDGDDPAKCPYMMAYARALKEVNEEYRDKSWLKD